ncbi:PREDICTED: UDP-glucuronosyltransferase 2B7-like [Dinoponera quadriceps]|uniref:UDP-glucuronosyltransferase 2B7-like n=1 Tax=Dinoponera quadriceps TaxID=609295 RepID=A0A6P3XW18_DINQU|nr:PREDICTED: UDP-glucuronosyltransferase 2B7-like [Dinoponera quadriceps]
MQTRNALLSITMLLSIVVNCKRILIITPAPLHSHQLVFRPLWQALHKRGHELVLITIPINATLSNYTEIDFSFLKVTLHNEEFMSQHLSNSIWQVEKITLDLMNMINRETFEHPQVRQLYAPESNEKFDLVIVDVMLGPALCSFAYRFHAPLIGITSTEVYQYIRYLLGDLLLPSYPSNWEFDRNAGFNLPFWQRMTNYLEMLAYIYRWTYIYMPQQQEIARKYLSANAGDLFDTIGNMSLLFLGRSFTFTYIKPKVPNIIYFDSLHVTKKPSPLPKNLKQFLDGATEGFVYMSLGSTINSSCLPKEKLSVVVQAFTKLPYKILWKFEKEKPPRIPDNVFIMKWIPQQEVLAHPNIKVFVYQGGVQSTEEAIHFAVPLVGIPLMYDQGYTINRLFEKGVARRLNYNNLSDTDLVNAIRDVFNDKQYKENMIRLSDLIKDKPVDDIEKLVWWIEHVMRYNGVPYMRYNGADQPFYERYDTNIIAFLAIAIFMIIMILLFVLTECLYFIIRNRMLIYTTYKPGFHNMSVKEKTS